MKEVSYNYSRFGPRVSEMHLPERCY